MITSTPSKCDSLLFVYGTLRPFANVPMARWLQSVAVLAGRGRTAGRLYDLGPYPGLVAERRRGEWVTGDVYRLRSPLQILRRLDRYEAGPAGRTPPRFVRVRRRVEIRRGRFVAAWLYVYRPTILRRARIAHGDYSAHAGAAARR